METAYRSLNRMSRRSKRTRLPRSELEHASPLHVAGIPPMDVAGLRSRLNPRAQRRFDHVWATAFPSVSRAVQAGRPSRRSVFRAVHADALVTCGVARRVDSGGPLENVPFTVLEEKESGLRQRFILWTKEANSRAADAGYVADIPLGHISEYLSVATHECGSTRDFRTGFYAVQIPESARHLFRFQDAEGRWSELERLPMGHTCAPEIMHTLCASAAGDPTLAISGTPVQPEGALEGKKSARGRAAPEGRFFCPRVLPRAALGWRMSVCCPTVHFSRHWAHFLWKFFFEIETFLDFLGLFGTF